MKILKIFGIVAGIHAVALLLILANPGCSSTSASSPAPADTAPKADAPAPVIAVPGIAPAAANAPAVVPAPVSSGADMAIVVNPELFSPTRPGTAAASALETQPVADVTPATTYIVGKGDSLWSIAKKNNLKSSVLAKVNGLRPGTPLHLGQKLIIPGAAPAGDSGVSRETSGSSSFKTAAAGQSSTAAAGPRETSGAATQHVVKPGETLGAIARKYGVRVGELAAANNISDPQKIRPGQTLAIPARHGSAASAHAASAVAPTPAPSASQDLDAGLTPAAAGGVPTIKIDDSPSATKQP